MGLSSLGRSLEAGAGAGGGEESREQAGGLLWAWGARNGLGLRKGEGEDRKWRRSGASSPGGEFLQLPSYLADVLGLVNGFPSCPVF